MTYIQWFPSEAGSAGRLVQKISSTLTQRLQ